LLDHAHGVDAVQNFGGNLTTIRKQSESGGGFMLK
jgi:hypothetical protein